MRDTINVTNARKSLYRLIDEVQDSHEAIRITGKKGAAVLSQRFSHCRFNRITHTWY
jgi:PHD/YefM family antitoxin component YafN of YafNO toxin-antitoxin module